MKSSAPAHVLWSYDFELAQRNAGSDYISHFSGVKPFHRHHGELSISANALLIRGDVNLDIPLEMVSQLYLGFDEYFPRSLSKNFGLFWQPLRITLTDRKRMYLIIDYYVLGSKNKAWYALIKDLLS